MQETPPASAWPAISGSARTIASSSADGVPSLETAARTVPPSRRRRVSIRVSSPWMPTTPWRASQSENPSRPLGLALRPSRTTIARACGLADSDASSSTP